MARDCIISQRLLQLQADIFRIVCDPLRYGETLNSISVKSGIPYSTIRSYAGHNGEPHEMPVSAQFKLIGIIPAELLSLLLPDGHVIVRAPEQLDHDEIAEACADFLSTKHHAHHPESEAGREIGPNEDGTLRCKAARLKAVA